MAIDKEFKISENKRQLYLKRLRNLRPIDDDFMRCIFRDNIPLAQFVLRIVTGISDLEITEMETQRDMKKLLGARSICLDVYAADAAGKKYDLEIQKSSEGAGQHRARYHSSSMDIDNLDEGYNFDNLPDTYVIFITEHDIFREGQALYPIERVNIGTGEMFGDGEHILYVNGEYRDDTELGKLMHDFSCKDPEDMNFDLMKEISQYYKEKPKGVETMCKEFEDTYNEGVEQGIEQGIKQGIDEAKIGFAKNLLSEGTMTYEKIAKLTGLSVEEVKELDTPVTA